MLPTIDRKQYRKMLLEKKNICKDFNKDNLNSSNTLKKQEKKELEKYEEKIFSFLKKKEIRGVPKI